MSSADLWEDNYPHGTPAGYDGGCQGGACPAGVAYGLSCKIAKAKSSGDFQYQKLVRSGASIPDIADALGLVGTEPTAPQAKKAPAKKPAPTPATALGGMPNAEAASKLHKAATVAAVHVDDFIEPAEHTPEKYLPAEGTEQAKVILAETEAAIAKQLVRETGVSEDDVDDAAAAAVAIASTTASEAPAPKPAEIRAWAIAKGYEVGAKGKLPQHIIDHYWEATGRLDETAVPAPEPAEPAATAEEPGEVTVEISINVPDLVIPEPAKRPDWGTIATSVDVEYARRWAVRLEQELARITEQFEEAQREADSMAQDFLNAFDKARELTDRLTRRTEQRDTAEERARIAERAAAFALTKWGQERAANEASHALIVGQAHTINQLSDALAPPRMILGFDGSDPDDRTWISKAIASRHYVVPDAEPPVAYYSEPSVAANDTSRIVPLPPHGGA